MWSQSYDRSANGYDRAWATSGPRGYEEERQEYVPSTPADARSADRERPGTRPRPFSSISSGRKGDVVEKSSGKPWWERLHQERTGNAYRGEQANRMSVGAPPLVRARAGMDLRTRDQRVKDRDSSTTLSTGPEIQIGFDAPRTEYRPRVTYQSPYQSERPSSGAPAATAVRERPRSATSTSRPRHNYCFDTPGWKPAWGLN